MDLISRFGQAVSYRTVRIPNLDIGRRYEILSAERISTRYGPSVLLTITVGPSDNARVFLPTRYTQVFTDADLADVNTGRLHLHLIYRGTCPQTHSYMLDLES